MASRQLDGTSVGSLVPFAPTAACTEGESDSGIADDGRVWLSCWTNGGGLQTVRRIGSDGSVLGDTQVVSSGEGGPSATASDGSVAWFWEPTTRTLTRVDLRTGQDTSASAPAPSASSSLDLLGRDRPLDRPVGGREGLPGPGSRALARWDTDLRPRDRLRGVGRAVRWFVRRLRLRRHDPGSAGSLGTGRGLHLDRDQRRRPVGLRRRRPGGGCRRTAGAIRCLDRRL